MSVLINRLGQPRTAAVCLALLFIVLGVVNGLDFPLSVPYVIRETGHNYLDMCAFCDAAQVQSEVEGLQERGRLLQALLMSTIDIVVPLVSFLAGFSVIAALRRRARNTLTHVLLALPLGALGLDITENALIGTLLIDYPSRNPTIADLAGVMSGLKFLAYASVLFAMFALGGVRLWARAARTRVAP